LKLVIVPLDPVVLVRFLIVNIVRQDTMFVQKEKNQKIMAKF